MVDLSPLSLPALGAGMGITLALVSLVWIRRHQFPMAGRSATLLLAGLAFLSSIALLLVSALWEGALPPLALLSLVMEVLALLFLVKALAGRGPASGLPPMHPPP